MKANKGLIGLVAASVVIAGVIVFLTAKSNKKAIKKWGSKGRKMSEGVREIMKEAKQKIKDLKEEIANENKPNEALAQTYE